MGRTTVSMVGGLYAMGKGAAIGARIGTKLMWIPVIGSAMPVITGFVGGMVGYFGGSKIGDAVYSAGKKLANAAKTVAKSAINGLKSVGRSVANGIKSVGKAISRLFS